ncbi:MAG: hypothetical protein IT198_13745 [Acidimicrobiia bacterium]|nr:hypothetical protein [Acidimicrobiia bacterium]
MSRARRHASGDSGTAIIAVLVFMLFLGVIALAVGNYAFTTFKAADVTIDVTDEVSAQTEALDESIAFLREATGGAAAQCANPGYTGPPIQFVMQDPRRNKSVRVTCTYAGDTLSSALAPDFAAIILGDSGSGPFLEVNGIYDTSFTGDIVLKHPAPGPTVICLEEYPTAGCETGASGGRAGSIVVTDGVVKSVVPGPDGLDLPPKLLDSTGAPVVWEQDVAVATDPDPGWVAPDTSGLPAGGYSLTGCRSEGFDPLRFKFRHSCIRAYEPGAYSSKPDLKSTQGSGAMDGGLGTCADWNKYCVVRANWLKPGIYRMDVSLSFRKSGVFDTRDAPVIGGTLANPTNPQSVAEVDRCVQGEPGVALVFGSQYGIHHYNYAMLGEPTVDLTLCHVTPEQLVSDAGVVVGQPGIAVYQESDGTPSGTYAINSSECMVGSNGALVIHGLVYAPEGEVFACTGHSTNPIKVGTGVVAWSLKVAAYDLADYNLPLFGHSESGTSTDPGVAYERTLDLTVETCSGVVSDPALCTPESSVGAQLKLGYDTDVTAWISQYLPGGE